ncbi:MAG: DNA repair protein RecO [Deltaproteobacteria bacterium]|nr:DNA repair protein RecO [Deltaproteobacteria bacterium]
MPILKKSQAIVINKIPYGEIDKIVTFFSLDYGKLKTIAKGAQKSRKRFSGALEPFVHLTIHFSEKSDAFLASVDQTEIINPFYHLREDLIKFAYASYILELVNEMLPEKQAYPKIFDLLLISFKEIDSKDPNEEILRIFETRLLSLAGYEIELKKCIRCSRNAFKTEKLFFAPSLGGLICSNCIKQREKVFSISHGTIKSLLFAQSAPTSALFRLSFSKMAIMESKNILPSFIESIIGKKLKSLDFLLKVIKNERE